MTNPLRPHEALILSVARETEDTVTYTLAFKDRHLRESYAFRGGQFNMIGLAGPGEAAISLSSDPAMRGRFEHTIRTVGNVTTALARQKPGDTVGVRGPYGTAWPLEGSAGRDLLLVAGGLGLAPLRPVVEHVLGNRPVYGHLTLLYGAKTPPNLLFGRDYDRWSRAPDTTLLLTVDRVDGTAWAHHVGVIPTLLARVELSPAATTALVCGPEIMMRFVLLELLRRGFPRDRVYLSLERRMRCGIGQCGHCFLGPKFVCRDGPIFRYDELGGLFEKGV